MKNIEKLQQLSGSYSINEAKDALFSFILEAK